jgi:hypothetical protein
MIEKKNNKGFTVVDGFIAACVDLHNETAEEEPDEVLQAGVCGLLMGFIDEYRALKDSEYEMIKNAFMAGRQNDFHRCRYLTFEEYYKHYYGERYKLPKEAEEGR